MARRAAKGTPRPGGGSLAKNAGDDLLALSKDLKQTAEGKVILKEMLKGIQQVAKEEVTPASRQNAVKLLPRSGGLARLVSKAPQKTVARAGATTASVTVRVVGAKKGSGASQADSGTVRHPVFNQRNAAGKRIFVGQKVPPRWFTGPAEDAAPLVQAVVFEAVDNTIRGIGFR